MDESIKAFTDQASRILKEKEDYYFGKNIWIYGAGRGGEIVYDLLIGRSVSPKGFIDSNFRAISKKKGLPVVPFDKLRSEERVFVIVALINFDIHCLMALYSMGFTKDDIAIIPEKWITEWEDINWRGCKIGRGTYGYKGLLSDDAFCPTGYVGRFCSINESARVRGNHPYSFVSSNPMFYYPYYDDCYSLSDKEIWDDLTQKFYKEGFAKQVQIGNDVWIGANAVILPNVKVGDGAVIGAGAVVTKNVNPYEIVAGIPARRIKYRFGARYRKQLLKIKWWEWEPDQIIKRISDFHDIDFFVNKYGK